MGVYRESRKPLGSIEYLYECYLQTTHGRTTVVQPHIHDSFEILYCVQGGFHLTLGGREYPLQVGDLALVDPMEVHTTQSLSEGDNLYYVLKFAPEVLYSADQQLLEMNPLMTYLRLSNSHQKVFFARELSEGGMEQAIPQIYDEYRHKDYAYALAIRTLISGLFLWILRKWHRDHPAQELDSAAAGQLAKALGYMEANYAQEITMSDAADECDMSYTAFSRFFSKYAQKGFAEALTQLRVKKSMLLLASTDLSVTDIAMQTGFSTTSYFIQRFKAQSGVTPRQFREYYRMGGDAH